MFFFGKSGQGFIGLFVFLFSTKEKDHTCEKRENNARVRKVKAARVGSVYNHMCGRNRSVLFMFG
jgi:hypothetical protein